LEDVPHSDCLDLTSAVLARESQTTISLEDLNVRPCFLHEGEGVVQLEDVNLAIAVDADHDGIEFAIVADIGVGVHCHPPG